MALFCSLLFVLLPALASAQALTVTAMWDPSPPNSKVSSYEVCIGTSSLACDLNLVTVSVNQTSYTFAPPPGQLVYVAVRALNQKGRGHFSNEQSFSIPFFPAQTNRSSALNAVIAPINLGVSDPDGSRLTFTHTGLPLGVTMNSTTGQITGKPTNAGTYNVTIFVNDGLKTVSRTFVWTVAAGATADQTPPTLTITSHTSGLIVTSASQTIRGTATDSGRGGSGITTVRVNGQSATGGTATGSATATWSRTVTLSSGSNTITIDAVDGAGNLQMQQITLLLSVSGSSSNSSSSGRGSGSGGGTTTGGGGSTSGSTGGSGSSSSARPLTITSLTSNLASPRAIGTSINFTVTATGGRAPHQFKWLVLQGSTWTVVRNWSSSSTYTWRPTTVGPHSIAVWARDATTTADTSDVKTSVPFRVIGSGVSTPTSSPRPTSGPLTIAGLTSSLETPQKLGASVTFTALVTGGTGQYQIRWLLYDGINWTVVRNWSPATTYAWRPGRAGAYLIGVEVLDATSPAGASPVSQSVPFRIRINIPSE